ncbi:MAG: rhomboid family intramembrane serine protease [Bacteroidia bacterium]
MRNTLWDDFKLYVLHSGNVLNKLIAINVAVFILFALIWMIQTLFQVPADIANTVKYYLSLPSSFPAFVVRIWTFFTYQFLHAGFFHLLSNMLIFMFAGRIFREYLGDAKLLATYIIGGFCGGLMFIVAMQIFPLFQNATPVLVGASASVMAILVGIGTLLPNYTIHLLFLGPVRLIYIVVFLALVDVLSLAGSNAGGHFAHLGGAIWGFTYIRSLNNGSDLAAWFTKSLNWSTDQFKPKKKQHVKVSYYNDKVASPPPKRNKISQEEIDIILDKIAKSGYDSLSQHEKDLLFRASKEH